MDVNRQTWNAGTTLLVHPASIYVGLRSETTFVEKGEPLVIEAIVTDLDGNAISGQSIEMQAARLEWKTQGGEWIEEEVDVQSCSVESTSEAVSCSFDTEIGGQYRITATVVDGQSRPNRTSMTRWVSGGERPATREVTQEQIELIPDKEQYEPGDVAEILVQAPFSPAEGLITVARSGLLYTERFTIEDNSITLRVPIEDAHIPNLSVQVDLNGAAPRVDDEGEPVDGAPDRPAFATGSIDLIVPPLNRTLALEIVPEATELAPGESTTIDLTLTDADGEPVEGAELAVVVVDEAVLALTGYQLADPVATFYQQRSADVRQRAGAHDGRPAHLAAHHGGVGGHAAGGGQDALRHFHAMDVVGAVSFRTRQHLLALLRPGHGLIGREDHLARRGARRGRQPLGRHGHLLPLGRIEHRRQQLRQGPRLHHQQRLGRFRQPLRDEVGGDDDGGVARCACRCASAACRASRPRW